MQRLSGLDASFLYLETPASYMHVAGLMILDPATAPVAWSFDEVRDMYADRLHLAPPFRRRLVEVPLGLHHPVWIEDPDFDLDFHLHHIAVPPPGGSHQLATLAEEIVARPLDRRKPLWEAWIIEGLEHGYIAVLTKTHHAAIDGVAGNELTLAMLDTEPEGRVVEPGAWKPEHVPNDVELIGYALSSLARQPAKLVSSMGRTGAMALNIRRQNRKSDIAPPPAPFSAPRASWNHALSPHRSYAMKTLSLDDAKAVKNAFGTTLNDVVMAMCAGSLRAYWTGGARRSISRWSQWCRCPCERAKREAPAATASRRCSRPWRRPSMTQWSDSSRSARECVKRRTSSRRSARRRCRTGPSSLLLQSPAALLARTRTTAWPTTTGRSST